MQWSNQKMDFCKIEENRKKIKLQIMKKNKINNCKVKIQTFQIKFANIINKIKIKQEVFIINKK